MSFPASKYSRYKRVTAFFLDWLLRARGRGRFAGKRLDLNAISAVVEDIAQDPTTLTPKLLQGPGSVTGTTEIRRFENYYQVLQEDEDYFPDEETFIKDKGASKKSKAERKRLFDGAFAQDLQMEVVCFFMELEELVEGVFSIYD
ncbi:hypothetical protein JG688_00007015 [Phytophthora aleatoria]|uniref:Uncharacterized protein n=1 Tax=Phytophthora aleatoria TaxID=2496075 RepID=A0A8J5M8F7_9STRA|nr:hypothetical protein JG688_00007015 [Phytophthora aleatoria]